MGRMGSPALKKKSQSVVVRNSYFIKTTSGEGQRLSTAHSIPSICRDSPGSEHGESGPAQIRWGATGRERREGGSAGEVQRERSPYSLRGGFLFPLAPRASDLPTPVIRVPSVMWERGLGLWAFWSGNRTQQSPKRRAETRSNPNSVPHGVTNTGEEQDNNQVSA